VYLGGWLEGSPKCTPFAVPMALREQIDLLAHRYSHLTKITGISYKSKHGVEYPSFSSSVRPVLHSRDLRGPNPPQKWTNDDDNEPVRMEQKISDPGFQPSTSSLKESSTP
jgi:hypothetical protein